MFVALVASAIVADAIGIELDAGKRFGENAFGTKAHENSRVQGSGSKDQGSGFREQGQKTGYRVQGTGSKDQGTGFRRNSFQLSVDSLQCPGEKKFTVDGEYDSLQKLPAVN